MRVPAAKIAVAVAARVFLVMFLSLTGLRTNHDSGIGQGEVRRWRRCVIFRSLSCEAREACRRKCSLADSQPGNIARQVLAQRKAGSQAARRLAGLDAVARLVRPARRSRRPW